MIQPLLCLGGSQVSSDAADTKTSLRCAGGNWHRLEQANQFHHLLQLILPHIICLHNLHDVAYAVGCHSGGFGRTTRLQALPDEA